MHPVSAIGTLPQQERGTNSQTCSGALDGFAVLLAVLTACAAPGPPPAVKPSAAAAVAKPAEYGTILAVHRVATQNSPAARLLLGRLGDAVDTADAHSAEFIVRIQDGATISVVQSDADVLRRGDRVTIQRGATSAHEPRLRPIGG